MMLALFPSGFEERETRGELDLIAYTDAAGEQRVRAAGLGPARVERVEPGWEERWREFHRGSLVGPLWIGPPWEAGPVGVEAIVIDPGLAFGTGSHATTRLCVELLCGLPRTALLDAGCGSGVLAIAAVRLGFFPVWAVDLDPQAVQATMRNAAANGVSVHTAMADALSDRLPDTPAAVANLTGAAVLAFAPRLPQATLVTSGYLASDVVAPDGRRRLRRLERDGWAADVWAPSRT